MAVRNRNSMSKHPVWELDLSYTNPITGSTEYMRNVSVVCMSPDEAISFVKSALNLGHCAKTFRVSKVQDITEFVSQEDFELWDYGDIRSGRH